MASPKGKPLGVLVYISVDEIDKTLEKVVKMGGKIIAPKSKEGENAITTYADPYENRAPARNNPTLE